MTSQPGHVRVGHAGRAGRRIGQVQAGVLHFADAVEQLVELGTLKPVL
jgi:hypothetical protein